MKPYNKIIKIIPDKRFGKPCIRNTRIIVFDILGWLGSGINYDEVLSDFPKLTIAEIRACLMYAADREHKFQTL